MKTMKKQTIRAKTEPDELREHYDFDYSKAKPNRFAERLNKETTLTDHPCLLKPLTPKSSA